MHDTAGSLRAILAEAPKQSATHSLEQALKDLSVHELCALMEDEKLNFCARAFETERVDGKELFKLSKDDFIFMLTDTGGIADSHCPNLLSVSSHLE